MRPRAARRRGDTRRSDGLRSTTDAIKERSCRSFWSDIELAPQDLLAEVVLPQRLCPLTTVDVRAHHHPVRIFTAGIVSEQSGRILQRGGVIRFSIRPVGQPGKNSQEVGAQPFP